MTRRSVTLPKGIYAPLPTFFLENEDLDVESFVTHLLHVCRCGTIPVVNGSAGEAPHLTSAERSLLIRNARDALVANGMGDVPIVAGIGVPSTRETISLAKEAAHAGADFVMIISPGYYAGSLMKNPDSLKQYFIDIADASPIPAIVYNFPSVTSGIDLDADFIADVARASSNVAGAKLTYVNSPEFNTEQVH